MKYSIVIARRANRTIHKLPKDSVQRVAAKIDELTDNPRPSGCRKLRVEADRYRIRVGDYRILYSIDDERRNVLIHRIVHRREAYR